MESFKNHPDSSALTRTTQVLISTICTLILLYWGKFLFIPLALAFLFAIFLYPLTKFFESKHFSKLLAASASAFLFLLFLCLVIYFFSTELSQFIKVLPGIKTKLDALINNVQTWMARTYHINGDSQASYINSTINKFFSFAGDTISLLLEGIILFTLVLFFTFYMLYHRKLLQSFVYSFFKQTHRKKIEEITLDLRRLINGYVKGLMIEMLILIVASFILLLILGIKYALLMAVFAGVLNLIPYIGIYSATAVNVLITLTTGNSTRAIEVAAVFLLIHVIDANIILPRIVGSSVKMNPFVTLIAVVAGNLLWGIPGMFLFIPLTAIFRLLSEKIKEFRSWAILIGEEADKKV
jgi:predicted PurR-regulated permease PerM